MFFVVRRKVWYSVDFVIVKALFTDVLCDIYLLLLMFFVIITIVSEGVIDEVK